MNRPVASGVSRANPNTMADMLPKLAARLRVGSASIPTPTPSAERLPMAAQFTARRALVSSPERERAARGCTEAASQAGRLAASSVASTPTTPPLIRLVDGMPTLFTVSTK
jgi:hypothetical protein